MKSDYLIQSFSKFLLDAPFVNPILIFIHPKPN